MAGRRTVVALALSLALTAAGGGAVVVTAGRAGDVVHGVTPVSGRTSPTPPAAGPDLRVDGAPLPAVDGPTVRDALAAAGIRLQPGHYLAIVSQHRLGVDGRPGRVLVDGRPATLDTPVQPGARITTRRGADLVEPTEVVRVPVPPAPVSTLYVGQRDGLARVVRGRLSHEVVSRRILRRPAPGHLVRRGAVALTFDDGPGRHWTRQVLAVLHRHHVHATFCMVGTQAAARPWLVRDVLHGGHALCDHTWDHDLALRGRPAQQRVLDIGRGARAITRATHGVRPSFFRAPGGNWSPSLEAEARAQGMAPLKWTVDPRDWARPGVHAIVQTVLQEVRPGGVILMHDGGGNRAQTLDALRVLLHRLPKMGYHFVLPPAPVSPKPAPTSTPAG